ncbi:polymorphic toxin-type HINT domain-containing protein [Gloeobacter morelensis]|uniref:Intein C-terminal splicing domain-containing protein n=1 Tax=Gloeobacter morelensis MG652769 TaxID=2781736 RepID=A0ABY3PKV9_9CYAN|nr:polymorphic toxin-type HINT domain-containing protein [Gloeobacter morelensis]UFP94209.1 hypothetical protein ISF26_21005 [Gloeobacter morelensis MG652769]
MATEAGAKPIELVEPGEKVLARNEQTGEQSLRRVQSTFQFDERPVYRLELREEDRDGERDVLTVTGEHPFFLQGQGWTAAEKLQVGDRVQAADGHWLRVAGLQAQKHRQRTYNLEVEGDHTFFVGDTHAWVHNARCFTSPEPLVAKVANEIEARYPGLVQGVNITRGGVEIDIETVNAIIEVKEGGKKLTKQVIKRITDTKINPLGKPVFAYSPKLGKFAIRDINELGGLATRNLQDILDLLAP